MRVGLIKKNGRAYVQLPEEFLEFDVLELFPLKQGYYLLSLPLGQKELEKQKIKTPEAENIEKKEGLTELEKNLLRRLNSIKFSERTPKNVDKMLNGTEKELLKKLINRGLVNVFYGKKYKDTGVYNISDNVYAMIRGNAPTEKIEKQTNVQPENITATPSNLTNTLFKQGYALLSNNNEAYRFSEEIRKSGRASDVVGIKGFDGKYYVVSAKYLAEMAYKIKTTMKGDMNAVAVAKACKSDETGCRAVLLLMAERGEAIEKKKDTFMLV